MKLSKWCQITLGTFGWLLLLMTILGVSELRVSMIWRWLALSGVMGLMLGWGYPYIWNETTWSAPVCIVVATVLNVSAGFLMVALFSITMLNVVWPFWWAVGLATLLLHGLAFYFYRRYQNKRMAQQLNRLSK